MSEQMTASASCQNSLWDGVHTLPAGGDARKRALLTERAVLELIHKRVGWKLADEDLQGKKRWREREEGRGGQMEGGRETVGNRAEDTALSQSCLFSAAACGLTGIPSGPVRAFSAPPGTSAIASPAPALTPPPTSP